MKIDGECLIELIGSCRNKGREPVAVSAVLPGLWGSRNRRALILGWAYYLDAFSSYPLRTWLPSVYRGHDNWSRHKVRILALPEWYLTDGSDPPQGGLSSFHLSCAGKAQSQSQGTVVRIFTDMSISPSLSPRQCPDRYAFRAGRNLPDKEFRYLRTVIVTAAVHRGFGRRLPPCHQVTNFLDLPALGRRQPPYVVLRLRGDLCFGKQSPGPGHCDPFVRRQAPLSPKLRGYFAEFLRESCLAPLGTLLLKVVRAFPGSMAWLLQRRSAWYSDIGSRHFLPPLPPCPEKSKALTHPPWTNLAEEPLGFRGIDSHQCLRYSSRHSRFRFVHTCSRGCFPLRRNAPLPMHFTSHSFGRSLSPVHLRRKSARSVSYYALFQGWLLLGKPPGCLCTPTSFITERHAVRDPPSPSHCLGAHGFMFYFTPRWGFFSPFPHGTTSLSVTQEYLALQGGPCGFTRDSTCPMLLGSERKLVMLSATGLSPSRVQYSTASPSSTTLVLFSHNPVFTV
ncbi:hypothetical protein H6P81_021505 [Aristolochia fimbriata]|uniref:Uncharacterized protein n=1 Tax=Aristolochia fimbriata TaxID=158543 RepID=A0AAV7DQP9_ARIFI|nr:hypothetical protein H6P81_021505 [Aristolochia fimbriata]